MQLIDSYTFYSRFTILFYYRTWTKDIGCILVILTWLEVFGEIKSVLSR